MFAGVLRQMRRWGIDESDQGPVYLGYRLGHIHGDGRVFRALVYNKGAAVLHMLRRLVGDEAFFRGLRRFYARRRGSRRRAPTTSGAAMEAESGRPLERFFERWIYGSTLPQLKFSYRVEHGDRAGVVLRVEQLGRRLRRAGHRHAAVRRPAAGRRRRPGHRRRSSSCASRSTGTLRRRRGQQGRRHARRDRQELSGPARPARLTR